ASTGVATRIAGLSSASVICTREGKVKLLQPGSGLAASPEALVAGGPAMASLVAPEHLDGGGSATGDVFALGALLWQMLVGRPLAGDDASAHIAGLRAGTFVPAPPSAAGAEGVPE